MVIMGPMSYCCLPLSVTVVMCWSCWYWCWEQIDDCYSDISQLKFGQVLKQDNGQDCGHKVFSGYWSWSLIEIMKLKVWGWCLVYILKYFEVEETWSKFWDLCQNSWYHPKKVLLESTQPSNSVLPLAMFSSLSRTNDPTQKYLSIIEIRVA